MKAKSGKQVVYRYGKNVPASGKSVVDFAGHKLCHRSVGVDKSDLLVHIGSGIILRAYPKGTNRSVILDDMAENVEKLDHFLDNREQYLIEDRPKLLKEKDIVVEKTYDVSMSKYSDGSPVESKFKQEYKLPLKKTYDVSASSW